MLSSGVHAISDNADFTFDSSLVEDTTGKLLPNQLTVDNLTVEWVRKKMADLEVMLKECQTSLSNCDNCINRENRYVLPVRDFHFSSCGRIITIEDELLPNLLQ